MQLERLGVGCWSRRKPASPDSSVSIRAWGPIPWMFSLLLRSRGKKGSNGDAEIGRSTRFKLIRTNARVSTQAL